jgi:hypothetical protein
VSFADTSRAELLPAGDELLEPRVIAQRVEVGVDLEPAGREVVRDLQQWLELVERLLRLADKNVDPDELVLGVGPTCASLSATPRSPSRMASPFLPRYASASAGVRDRIRPNLPEGISDAALAPRTPGGLRALAAETPVPRSGRRDSPGSRPL